MKSRGNILKMYRFKAGVVIQLLAIGGFLCLFGASQNASATNYFNWGVESNTTSIGTLYGYHGGTTRDCTVRHSGTCSMRLNVIGNDSGNQGMGADINQNPYTFKIVGGPALFYRWWMKIQPGFKWGSGTAKTKSSRVIANTSSQGYTGYLMSYGFLIGECSNAGCTLNNGGSNGSDSQLVIPYDFRTRADGVWHEYIVKIKPNTSATCTAPANCDAQFQAWVDGVSIGQYNNFKLHNNASSDMREAWGGWMVTPYFQLNGTSSDGGTIYVDDFSTDNSYNSSIGGGTTTLSPPANLQVQ